MATYLVLYLIPREPLGTTERPMQRWFAGIYSAMTHPEVTGACPRQRMIEHHVEMEKYEKKNKPYSVLVFTRSVFTNHSQEYSISFSPRFRNI